MKAADSKSYPQTKLLSLAPPKLLSIALDPLRGGCMSGIFIIYLHTLVMQAQ